MRSKIATREFALLQFKGEFCANAMCRLIEGNLGVGIWSLDPATGQSYWSRGFYELLGLDPGNVAPSYEELDLRVHPDDRRPKHEIEALLREGLAAKHEFRIIKPNGRLSWISSQIEMLLDASGRPVRIQGVAHDITKHRETLQSLRGGVERYNALLQIAEGLVWTASPDGRITALPNWKTAEQNGPRLPYGNGWLDLLHEEERGAALKSWSDSVKMRRPYDAVHRLLQPDGTYRRYRFCTVPILNPDGSVQEWMGMSTDVHKEELSGPPAWPSKLTGAQMRAARGILNWSVKQLALRASLSPAVVRRLEEHNGMLPVSDELAEALQKVFSDAGIELLFPQFGKPGVRPR